MSKYHHYIQRYDKKTSSWSDAVDIEAEYKGLIYANCAGLSDKGKIKNIYTESYPEADELRVSIPEKPKRENTKIELELIFSGEDRRNQFDRFVEFVTGYKVRYWDTCRKRQVDMILMEEVKPSDDYLKGDNPFMVATFKFDNLTGDTTSVEV